MRINVTLGAMTKRVRIALQNHLARFVERDRQHAQPTDQPPQKAVIDNRLMRRGVGNLITNPAPRVLDRLAIARVCLFEELRGPG